MPERPRLSKFSSKRENLHGACNVDAVTSNDRRPMIRNRQSLTCDREIGSD